MKLVKLSFAVCFIFIRVYSQSQNITESDSALTKPLVTHSDKGFEFRTSDGKFLLQFAGRVQFRFSTPFDSDPLTVSDFNNEQKNTFLVNRARLKIGGYAYKPWLKYYFEYEMGQSNLLDFKVMVEKWKAISFKVGQWKTDFNRERVISSGEQQMMERSFINLPFTLDRQQGVEVYGHIDGRGAANFNYWLSILTGTGRGVRENDDRTLMYVARLQWNPLGKVVEMSGSDEERTARPALLIAVAGAQNSSPYTRFSQSGGGELEGFENGVAGQYDIRQALVETAFKYRGFSWQHETHFKLIEDNVNSTSTRLAGNYFQAGYFLNGLIHSIPPLLELAFRYADYRPDLSLENNQQHEYSTSLNWFFNGHKNKLTAEYSYIVFDQTASVNTDGSRFRLQWDISF
jgi:phosphate-selective porin OprO and OprP